eukprot:TRINITY_DN3036_c0_g2_i1.p1 TRINITY_DN3036_c0_g2~~TRINITY_DN3036_c0_g2_i1.p1  ORF type:complete len:462 (+),score=121.19 TRINITY_DN3036_c0_g2_i1:159-1544(+)
MSETPTPPAPEVVGGILSKVVSAPAGYVKSFLADKAKSAISSSVIQSDYFKTTATVLVVGALAKVCSQFSLDLIDFIKALFVVSAEVNCKDEAYQWIVEWLALHPYTLQSCRNFSITSIYEPQHRNNPMIIQPTVVFAPSLGWHLLRYQGTYLWINRIRDSNATDLTNGGLFESFKIISFGKSRKTIESLISDARKCSLKREEGMIIIYNANQGTWHRFGSPRTPRPMASVLLPQTTKSMLLDDITRFFDSAKFYRDMGIPYRRGFLLHGNPGSGKTSFIYALAGELKMNICIANLSNPELNDDLLNQLFNEAPPKSIILLEDVDAAFVQRDAQEKGRGITFSGLLNALDGVASQEGGLLFMTTNKYHVLDEALIRPGRIDLVCHFTYAVQEQVEQLFVRFFPEATAYQVKTFSDQIPNDTISMAELQGYLLKNKRDPSDAIQNSKAFIESIQLVRARKNV